ncbi:MAG TPA: MarR family transcriptional regulator [Candidatus Egerieimonas intestinavium]|uniref:MarR family transcriptional regulator n=1 Tax=Candidatus Egerieimonas intestinavium TaxID=2840777 RepID=A0A9D1ELU0_9FIRM|nr:MarR family transcriptional regulator [Candidatus Egerieimonas intestinavium]
MDYREIAEEFCQIWAVNARRMEKMEKSLSARGEGHILRFLAQAGSEMPAGQLSRISGLSVSRVTNILNSLEKKALIRRRADQEDRRRVFISLTDTGRTFIEEKYQEVVEAYEKAFRRLGERDSLEYIRLIKKFSAIMSEEVDLDKLEKLNP